jgi:hypothetical protein
MELMKSLRGFFHVQIEENGEVVGDSGIIENQVTNDGFLHYLVELLGAIAGSSQIGYVALGTGTAPGAADTSLQGEVEVRAAVTAATSSNSKTLRFTATFASENSFVSDTVNIANLGLFALSEGGVLFAGNTFASSSCAVNQAVQVTYDLVFQ